MNAFARKGDYVMKYYDLLAIPTTLKGAKQSLSLKIYQSKSNLSNPVQRNLIPSIERLFNPKSPMKHNIYYGTIGLVFQKGLFQAKIPAIL